MQQRHTVFDRHTSVIIDISIRGRGVISGRSRTRANVRGDRYWAGDIDRQRRELDKTREGSLKIRQEGKKKERKGQIRTVERWGVGGLREQGTRREVRPRTEIERNQERESICTDM